MTPEQEKIYEDGFLAGQEQLIKSSVHRAVNRMAQREWVGLTDEEVQLYSVQHCRMVNTHYDSAQNTNLITEEFDAPAFYKTIEAALRSRNT